MKAKKIFHVIILTLLFQYSANAQYADHSISFTVNYNFTTSSRLYLFPNSIDPMLRENYDELKNINSYSAEVKYRINQPFAVGISFEYLEKTHGTKFTFSGSDGSKTSSAEEGFSVIPIEITGYYILPFSTEKFKFHMGLGGGIYFGNHIRRIKNVEFETVSRQFAYGIHVNVGMDYMINDYLSVRTEMRFRDPQFEVESKYNKKLLQIDDAYYVLPENSMSSKINVNGLMFSLGLTLHLF